MSGGTLSVVLLAAWLLPALALLVCFELMRDEPGGPDRWMALLWPLVLVALALSEAWHRVRRSRRP